MDLNKIEILLEKYNHGLTSLEEEAQLSAYFLKQEIPEHLQVYSTLFNTFKTKQSEVYSLPIVLNDKSTKLYYGLAIAASLILFLAIVLNRPIPKKQLGTFSKNETQIAYQTFKETMSMVSLNFNQGLSQMEYLNTITKGKNELKYLDKFNNATHIIFKPSN